MQNLDSLGVGSALELFPDQVKTAWSESYSVNFTPVSPSGVLISGMGGSSNAAKIIDGISENDSRLSYDIDIYNDYGLPSWVNQNTLVIANSYSGNTEETLSAVTEAKIRGSKIIGVTTGGKIAEMIKKGEIEGAIVDGKKTNPTGFPKTGLGVSFGALAGVLSKLGILKLTESELFSSLDELREIRKSWNTKSVATWLQGSLPVLLGGRPLIGSLNAARNAMCEISRNFTQFYDFPEVNHVLIEAMQTPQAAKAAIKYLIFVSKFNHPRVLTRYRITAKMLTEMGLSFDNYTLKGQTKLTQSLELPFFSALVAYDLAILDGVDPGPEPWILKLKDSLASNS